MRAPGRFQASGAQISRDRQPILRVDHWILDVFDSLMTVRHQSSLRRTPWPGARAYHGAGNVFSSPVTGET